MAKSMNDLLNDANRRIRQLQEKLRSTEEALEAWKTEAAELGDQVQALQASRSKLSATLRLLCGDLITLSTETAGVAGWHKNGQIAAWDTFEEMMKIARDYHDKKEFDRLKSIEEVS